MSHMHFTAMRPDHRPPEVMSRGLHQVFTGGAVGSTRNRSDGDHVLDLVDPAGPVSKGTVRGLAVVPADDLAVQRPAGQNLSGGYRAFKQGTVKHGLP